MLHQIIYISPSDAIEEVKDKLKKSTKEKVVLVFPEENEDLKTLESLVSIEEYTRELGKMISIYSTDSKYKKLASKAGIDTETSLVKSSFADTDSSRVQSSFRPKMKDIVSPQEGGFVSYEKEEEPFIKKKKKEKQQEREEKRKEKKEKEQKEMQRPRKVRGEKAKIKEQFPQKEKTSSSFPSGTSSKKSSNLSWFIYLLIGLVVIGAGIFAFTWLPKAEVTIIPASEKLNFEGSFTAVEGSNFDLEEKVIPGDLVQSTKKTEKKFSATGEKKKVQKASGKITIYNEDNVFHRLVPETRFKSKSGKVFRIQDWVRIPGGTSQNPGQVSIKVVANEAGKEYNIGPSTFTVPGLKGEGALYDWIYAKSTSSMDGGFTGKATILTRQDKKNAKEKMQKVVDNLVQKARKEIVSKLPSDFNFLKEEIPVEKSISYNQEVGDITKNLKATVKVSAEFLVFEENYVQKILADTVSSRIKESVEFKQVVSSREINYELADKAIEQGKIIISFEGKENVAWKVTSRQIENKLLGMSAQKFKDYVKDDMKGKIENAKLKLWPFWVGEIPKQKNRVFIEVKFSEKQ